MSNKKKKGTNSLAWFVPEIIVLWNLDVFTWNVFSSKCCYFSSIFPLSRIAHCIWKIYFTLQVNSLAWIVGKSNRFIDARGRAFWMQQKKYNNNDMVQHADGSRAIDRILSLNLLFLLTPHKISNEKTEFDANALKANKICAFVCL